MSDTVTVTATFPDFKSTSVTVDPWDADNAVETFTEMGALYVTTR